MGQTFVRRPVAFAAQSEAAYGRPSAYKPGNCVACLACAGPFEPSHGTALLRDPSGRQIWGRMSRRIVEAEQ